MWQIRRDSNTYRSIEYDRSLDRSQFMGFFRDGRPHAATWKHIEIHLYEGDAQFEGDIEREKAKPLPDFSALAGGIPIVNGKALAILRPLIDSSIEALPLKCGFGSFFALNTEIIDCLDHTRSKIKRMPNDGRIISIDGYVFKKELLGGKHVFRIPEEPISATFVSDAFKNLVEEHNLTGLFFTKTAA